MPCICPIVANIARSPSSSIAPHARAYRSASSSLYRSLLSAIRWPSSMHAVNSSAKERASARLLAAASSAATRDFASRHRWYGARLRFQENTAATHNTLMLMPAAIATILSQADSAPPEM